MTWSAWYIKGEAFKNKHCDGSCELLSQDTCLGKTGPFLVDFEDLEKMLQVFDIFRGQKHALKKNDRQTDKTFMIYFYLNITKLR